MVAMLHCGMSSLTNLLLQREGPLTARTCKTSCACMHYGMAPCSLCQPWFQALLLGLAQEASKEIAVRSSQRFACRPLQQLVTIQASLRVSLLCGLSKQESVQGPALLEQARRKKNRPAGGIFGGFS